MAQGFLFLSELDLATEMWHGRQTGRLAGWQAATNLLKRSVNCLEKMPNLSSAPLPVSCSKRLKQKNIVNSQAALQMLSKGKNFIVSIKILYGIDSTYFTHQNHFFQKLLILNSKDRSGGCRVTYESINYVILILNNFLKPF